MDPEATSLNLEAMPDEDIKPDQHSLMDYGPVKKEQCDICTQLLSKVKRTVTAFGHRKATTDAQSLDNVSRSIFDESMEQMSALKKHIEAVHENKTDVNCQLDSKRIEILHEEKKYFFCNLCTKSF